MQSRFTLIGVFWGVLLSSLVSNLPKIHARSSTLEMWLWGLVLLVTVVVIIQEMRLEDAWVRKIRTVVPSGRILRIIAGQLKSCIVAHGPISEKWTGSAAKRVYKALRGEGIIL